MTRKHSIRAPRKPKGEHFEATIGNQERQIAVLIDRCVKLETERNEALVKLSQETMQHGIISAVLTDKREECAELKDALAKLTGWQECARELLLPKFPGFGV